ncbi:molybdopterin-dependent oxidoreductase [Rhodovulum sp. DZ06]|uniref:molybdopterin-dependent oxidoreductase n=1 Tax=Rhodovulum sp. DZ06 TaxID=3425126 RepID=UPI003D344476
MPHDTLLATHWGTYRVRAEKGRLTEVLDWEGDPDPSPLGRGWLEAQDAPSRIRRPAIRKGFLAGDGGAGRGRDAFVEVSWDEALDAAAAEIERVRAAHGNGAIYGGSYGWASAGRFHHAQSQIHRFLNCAGGYVASVGNYSYAAAAAISRHVVGDFSRTVLDGATDWHSVMENTKLVIAFGGLPRKNAQVTSGGVGRHWLRQALRGATANGCRFVNVSPLASDIDGEVGAEHLAMRPGADTAMMLAMAYTLLDEGLHDAKFLSTHAHGFPRFAAYLRGETDGIPKTPDWAAPLCEIPAERIAGLAREAAGTRSLITVAWSLQRADNGEQPVWAAIALAAMLGQIGLPGGGFGIGYASENGIGVPVRRMSFPAVPQGENKVQARIPVARIADALLHPGAQYRFDGKVHTYPDLRCVLWAGGNPFHHHQDVGRLARAFRRPESVIVNEIHWTPMARFADIVLPSLAPMEREDVAMTHWEPTIVWNGKATEPVGEARSDYDIYAGIAARLGCADAFTEGRTADEWIAHLWDQARQRFGRMGIEAPSLDALKAAGTWEMPATERPQVLMEAFRISPVQAPLETRSGRIEIFCDAVAEMGLEGQPGHPVWIPPKEWLGAAQEGELHLITNQPETRLHSQLDAGGVAKAGKVAGREPVWISPADAAARGIADGEVVRIFNARGACLAGAVVTDAVRPGVLRLPTGAWYDPADPDAEVPFCKHGSANVLTRDEGTSGIGQGSAAQSALVRVETWQGEAPAVTAHDGPEFASR